MIGLEIDFDPDRLYALLPAVVRRRDDASGQALRALLTVIGEELGRLEGDIARLYRNWFIETCDEWAVPYIADLIGVYPSGTEQGRAGARSSATGAMRALVPRREVAKTFSYRRRKGSLLLLEEIAWDLTGWPARAVEYDALVVRAADLRRPELIRRAVGDIRSAAQMQRLRGPFEVTQHVLDVRRFAPPRHTDICAQGQATPSPGAAGKPRMRGRYRPGNVGLFVWRTIVRGVIQGTAAPVGADQAHAFRYTFDPAGLDVKLYARPDYAPGRHAGSGIDPEIGFPVPLAARHFQEPLNLLTMHQKNEPDDQQREYPGFGTSVDVWGAGRSLMIFADWDPEASAAGIGSPGIAPESEPPRQLEADEVRYMSLDPWPKELATPTVKAIDGPGATARQLKQKPQVVVDPVRGRMMFPTDQPQPGRVWVTYHYAAPGDIGAGGGGSGSPSSGSPPALLLRVSARQSPGATHSDLTDALDAWSRAHARSGVIEILDSATYAQPVNLRLIGDQSLTIRAAQGCRPVISFAGNAEGRVAIRASAAPLQDTAGARLIVEGLLISGTLELVGSFAEVAVRGCTIMPVQAPLEVGSSEGVAIWVGRAVQHIRIQKSIVGPLHMADQMVPGWDADQAEATWDWDAPAITDARLLLTDSIVDAQPPRAAAPAHDDSTRGKPEQQAPPIPLAVRVDPRPDPFRASFFRCTIIGQTEVPLIDLAENTLFCGPVRVMHRQEGGMRFCYVAPGSRTPRRYECPPDGVADPSADALTRRIAQARVRPHLVSTAYPDPGYGVLAADCPPEILGGADDEGEIGAMHDSFERRRLGHLLARVDEFSFVRAETRVILLSPGDEHELRI